MQTAFLRFAAVLVVLAGALPAVPALGAESPGAPAQAAVSLPEEEHLVYDRLTGALHERVQIDVVRRSEKDRTWYEYSWNAPDEAALYILDAASLALIRSDVTSKSPDTTIRRTVEILEDRSKQASDELVLSATGPFLQRLRLIPYDSKPSYKVVFQGSPASSAFSLKLSVVARETITMAGKSREAWRLELGATGIIGGFFGKSRYWMAMEWPHLLLRSEAPASFPGSSIVRYELLSASEIPPGRK